VTVDPYFERTWNHFSSHFQTPNNGTQGEYSAAVVNGRTAYISSPIFGAFARHGNYPYRLLVRNMLQQLLPDPLIKLQGALLGTEVTVMKQDKRHIVHLLNYSAERRTQKLDIVEDVAPLHDVSFSLKLAQKPTKVYLAPSLEALAFKYVDGRAEVMIPKVGGHEMVVLE